MQNQTITVEQLVAAGGSEWRKSGKHRVYFNDLAGLYGLETNRYKTGNISSARLNGKEISNSRARQLDSTLQMATVWFDMLEGKFFSTGLEAPMMQIITGIIRGRVAEATARQMVQR